MIEQLTLQAIYVLPSAFIAFIGIAAFKYGLLRFSVKFKLSLVIVFIGLWTLGTFAGFLFGREISEKYPLFALPTLFIGIFLWLMSLLFKYKRK